MSLSSDIKTQIKAVLDALKTATTLGEVQVDDFKVGIFDRDFSAYPAVVLTSPATNGEVADNRDNFRTYIYEVVVFQKRENISSATSIETLQEAILDAFDNNIALSGTALGGVIPSSSRPEPATIRGHDMIVFSVIVQAKGIKQLTF